MTKLTPCRGCKRHCRVSETACPFCGARRLAIGASVVVFATLAVGWSGDAYADGAHDAAAETPENIAPNANAPDGGDAGDVGNWDRGERGVALYGMPPSPRSGC